MKVTFTLDTDLPETQIDVVKDVYKRITAGTLGIEMPYKGRKLWVHEYELVKDYGLTILGGFRAYINSTKHGYSVHISHTKKEGAE